MKFEKVNDPFFCEEYGVLCHVLAKYKIIFMTVEEVKKYSDPQLKDFIMFTPYVYLCPKHFINFLKAFYQGPYDEIVWDLI